MKKRKETSSFQRYLTRHEIQKVSTLTVTLASFLLGCTSGPGLTTGYVRPPIDDYRIVQILSRLPQDVEVIASVKASSDSGFSRERNLDYTINQLKKKAARLGANAIVITQRNSPTQMGTAETSGGGLVVTNNEREVVKGIAVWVD